MTCSINSLFFFFLVRTRKQRWKWVTHVQVRSKSEVWKKEKESPQTTGCSPTLHSNCSVDTNLVSYPERIPRLHTFSFLWIRLAGTGAPDWVAWWVFFSLTPSLIHGHLIHIISILTEHRVLVPEVAFLHHRYHVVTHQYIIIAAISEDVCSLTVDI